MKTIRILSEDFQFLVVKFSIYLNRRVFVMFTLSNAEIHVLNIEQDNPIT